MVEEPLIVGDAVARPTLYREEYAEQARKLCLLGATDEDLAKFFEVAVSTISKWKIDHKAFSEAIKNGKQLADATVADRLYKRATGYEHEAVKIALDANTGKELVVPYIERFPPDTTACIFWLKNRQPEKWRDKVQNEVTGKDGTPLLPPVFNIGFDDGGPGE